MRTDRNSSSNLPDFSPNLEGSKPEAETKPTTTTESKPSTTQAPKDSPNICYGQPHDGIDANQPREYPAPSGKNETGLPDFSGNLPGGVPSQTELHAYALSDAAKRFLEGGGLKEALTYLARSPQEGATLKDLKALVEQLGHGGVLERAFDQSIGHKVRDAFQQLAKSPFAGGNINDFKQLLTQLAQSKDPAAAFAQFKDLGSKLGKLAEDAKKNGLGELAGKLASLSEGARQLGTLADKAKNLNAQSLQNFAASLGKDVKDLRTLEDLKTLADKNGVGGLLGHVLDSDVGKQIQTLAKAAEGLPDAKKKAEQFLSTLKGLQGKSPEELAKHLKDLPGGLQDLSKLARSLGQGDLANKLDQATTRFKQVSDLAKDLKGMTPQKAMDEAAKRLKNISPKDVLDKTLEHLPGKTVSKEGSFEVGGSVYKRKDTFGSVDGPYYMEHELEVLTAGAKGRGSVSADLKSGKLSAEGEIEAHAELIRARAYARAQYGIVSAEGTAALDVGARAAARGRADIDLKSGKVYAEGEAKAFAGVEASASGHIDAGGVGADGTAALRAGVGVNIGGSFGIDKGKVTFGFNIGASLGIGFNLGFKISLDFNKIGDTIKKYVPGAKVVFEAATQAASAVKGAVEGVGNALKDAGKAVKNFFKGW